MMQQPHAYVIVQRSYTKGNVRSYNNAELSQRLYKQTRRELKKHGWSFSEWPAVDGFTVDSAMWDSAGIKLLDRGKIIDRPGARGCFFSHWSLWNHCLEFGPITVLEHDAIVLMPWDTSIDYSQKLTKLHRDRGTKVNDVTGTWGRGAWAYTITPEQAQKLIDFTRIHGAQAVDKQLGSIAVDWSCLARDLVIHNPEFHTSTTSPVTKFSAK